MSHILFFLSRSDHTELKLQVPRSHQRDEAFKQPDHLLLNYCGIRIVMVLWKNCSILELNLETFCRTKAFYGSIILG